VDHSGEIANAAATTIVGITNWIQLLALALILGFLVFGLLIWKSNTENKKVIDANKETEKAETANRKLERDAQIREIHGEIDQLRDKYDNHIAEHGEMSQHFKDSLSEIKSDMKELSSEVRKIDRTLIKIDADLNHGARRPNPRTGIVNEGNDAYNS
jgi:seryl-tRNA synthetase